MFINTKAMTDRAEAERANARAEELLDKYTDLADEIYSAVAARFF